MSHTRDFEGYGRNPPDPRWPNGAKVALNFVINHEEGGEESVPDGDPRSENALTEGSTAPVKGRALGAERMFQYGSRVGFWRLLRLFQERNLPMTVFGCALALEQNPQAAAAIRAAGFDVCSHGWRWVKHFELSETEEREHIRLAVASLQQTVGHRPDGWYCRYGPSVNTRRLVVEEGGFLYDSDAYDDELPYWRDLDGRRHVVLPYAFDTNDMHFHQGMQRFTTAAHFAEYVIDAYDQLWREGGRMLSVGLHLRMIGRAGRIAGLSRVLRHMRDRGGAWFARRDAIARHWLDRFGP
jgi:peptidoglycan/xylan/chitin deacetylase (PgdA/CDA1 family)